MYCLKLGLVIELGEMTSVNISNFYLNGNWLFYHLKWEHEQSERRLVSYSDDPVKWKDSSCFFLFFRMTSFTDDYQDVRSISNI